MHSVQRIPVILLLVLLVAACGSTQNEDDLPLIVPEPAKVNESDLVPAARPSGYIADPVGMYFHRLDCPKAAEVKPSLRQFHANPYDALNEGFSPCEYCEPMAGWK
jgi:hypothetical protein